MEQKTSTYKLEQIPRSQIIQEMKEEGQPCSDSSNSSESLSNRKSKAQRHQDKLEQKFIKHERKEKEKEEKKGEKIARREEKAEKREMKKEAKTRNKEMKYDAKIDHKEKKLQAKRDKHGVLTSDSSTPTSNTDATYE